LFLLPGLSGVMIFYLLPFLEVVRRSFLKSGNNAFVGTDNYRAVFANGAFVLAARNTLLYMAAGVPLLMGISLFLSLLLRNLVLRRRLVSAMPLPMAVPAAVMVLTMQILIDIFAGVVVVPDDPPPGVAGRCTPAHRIFIIRGEAVQRTRAVWVIGIFCSSPAVAGVALVGINAAGIESGSGLGGDDLPLIGAMSGFGVKGTIVVDTDDAAGRVDLICHCRL